MQITLNLNNEQLASLCGSFDKNLDNISHSFGVKISNKWGDFSITGEQKNLAANTLQALASLVLTQPLTPQDIEISIKNHLQNSFSSATISIKTKRKFITVRGKNQQNYAKSIVKKDCIFGIGPAGTGKTYLAVARAVEALERSEVRRIILVRPAVEAGEKLGFLPGDLSEKIDPYLRPVYDALYEMLGFEKTLKLLDKNIIEVAPLAFMRGRTLNESFVILDEAQNTTIEQMKMFLTRLGFGSKMVITGDNTQIDLAQKNQSGLLHAMKVLKDEKSIEFCLFTADDVVRHKLVQRIVLAYENFK
jgi:phosphate starvation-inducible PhoH-like protein